MAEEAVAIRLRRARVANLHHRVRPRPLDRVAEQEDDLRLGEQLADPGDLLRLEDRVARCHLTCAATMPGREERGVPPVVPAAEEIASEPAELREGRPVQRAPGVSPDLAAPARPFDRPPEGAAHERAPGDALLVEVVQLLLGGKPHLGVLLQVPVEPGGAGLLSADADEVGSVRAHPPTVRGGARGGGLALPLRVDQGRDARDRLPVVGHDVLVVDLDAELLLEHADQLDHPERVDHMLLEQRVVVVDVAPRADPREVVGHQLLDLLCGHRMPFG